MSEDCGHLYSNSEFEALKSECEILQSLLAIKQNNVDFLREQLLTARTPANNEAQDKLPQGVEPDSPQQPVAQWQHRLFLGGTWSRWEECDAPEPGQPLEQRLNDTVVEQTRALYASPPAVSPSSTEQDKS